MATKADFKLGLGKTRKEQNSINNHMTYFACPKTRWWKSCRDSPTWQVTFEGEEVGVDRPPIPPTPIFIGVVVVAYKHRDKALQ
jgi:hypothetical protein